MGSSTSSPAHRPLFARRAHLALFLFALGALGIALTALCALSAVFTWVGSIEPVPPARYDEARDLPPLPTPEDNGMLVIDAAPPGTFDDLGWPGHDELFDGREGQPSLATLGALHDEIDAWSVPDEVQSTLDEALDRPRFAFACILDLREEPCPILEWFRAHRTLVVLALRDAGRGRDDDALVRAEELLIVDQDVLATASTTTQAMIAIINVGVSIELVSLLGAVLASRDPSAISPETLTRLDDVERALCTLSPDAWTIENGLIGEAIQSRRGAEMMVRDGHVPFGVVSAIRQLDLYYAALIAYARDPEASTRPSPPDEKAFSRVFEPYGLLALGMNLDFAPVVDRFREDASRCVDSVEAARVVLARARLRATSARAD